jgi:5-methylcytosine-specific restriction endonuclease McrA
MIGAALRSAVWQRAHGRCEYCLVHATDGLLPHEVDHIFAVQHGGPTLLENLALACFDCNRFKGTNLSSIDPQTSRVVSIFHPRRDQWKNHFQLHGAKISPLTAKGRATAALLRLNTDARLEDRKALILTGGYPPPGW